VTRAQLEHAIRAACNVAGDDEVWVFGSQAILGAFPDAPAELRTSIEVDIQPRNKLEKTVWIDGALGEGSMFNTTHGFYVHGVEIAVAKLAQGWQNRTIAVCDPVGTTGFTGWCLEPCDLAASKLFANRAQDREFVRILLTNKMIEPDILECRIELLPIGGKDQDRMVTWLRETIEDLIENP